MIATDIPNSCGFKGVFAYAPYEEMFTKTFDRPVTRALRETDAVRQALAFWESVRTFLPRFGANLEKMDKAEGGKLTAGFYNAQKTLPRDAFNLRAALLRPYRNHENPHVRAIAALECLPTPVFRRWLWHTNVDFQGYESFLRRITTEQLDSLNTHADVIWKSLAECRNVAETDGLPCFTEGWCNGIVNAFSQKAEPWNPKLPLRMNDSDNGVLGENRYVPKAAVAHDFLGWGLGFKRHSDETVESDQPNHSLLLLQPLLSAKGEEFSVNTESRGAYWWLYRTLRANRLWGKSYDVALRSHVCPGFWATVFAWAFFFFGSPACVAMAAFGTGLPDAARAMLLIPGAVTPLVLAAWGLVELFEKISPHYHRDFVKNLGAVVGVFAVLSVIGFLVFQLVSWLDWREPQNAMIFAFVAMWFAHMASKGGKFISPLKLPFFGPVLSLAIAARASYLGYRDYPEEIWTFLVFVGTQVLPVLLSVVVGLAFLAVALAMAKFPFAFVGNRMGAKRNETFNLLRKERPQEAFSHAKRAERLWVFTAIFAASAAAMPVLYLWQTSVFRMEGSKVYLAEEPLGLAVLYLGLIVFLSGVSTLLGIAVNFWSSTAKKVEREFVVNALPAFHIWEAEALMRNPLFHPSYGSFRFDLVETLRKSENFWISKRYAKSAAWSEMLSEVSEEGLKRFTQAKTKPYLLPYVALGLRYAEARKRYRQDLAHAEAELERIKAAREEVERRNQSIKTSIENFFDGCRSTAMFLPRMVIAAYKGLITLKEIFDNACPHVYRSKRMA